MRFDYQYRTADNELRMGVVSATTRDDAYAVLRERGIRASRLVESPGFFNHWLGKGKRWSAIVILSVLTVGAVLALSSTKKENAALVREGEDRLTYEGRGQLYGDPAVVRSLLREKDNPYLSDRGDLILAAYAVPCRPLSDERVVNGADDLVALKEAIATNLPVEQDDMEEVARLKRMINAMKREARAYLHDGGTIEGYAERLAERRLDEFAEYARMKSRLLATESENEWQQGLMALRERGLPLVAQPH